MNELVYLGSHVNKNYDVLAEIKSIISYANKIYFGLGWQLGSSLVSKATIIKIIRQ